MTTEISREQLARTCAERGHLKAAIAVCNGSVILNDLQRRMEAQNRATGGVVKDGWIAVLARFRAPGMGLYAAQMFIDPRTFNATRRRFESAGWTMYHFFGGDKAAPNL